MPNGRFLVNFWKCRKAVSILLHETEALLEDFCIQPIENGKGQKSSSSFFASWGKKTHDFTLADQDWIGLMIFKNFVDQDWIGFNFIGSGLDSDWKISQSAHLCMVHLICLFMKTHLLALLQDYCLDLVRCAFLHKLSACVRNITAFCQHLLRPILSAVLADTDISVKPKYWPDISVYL